MRALIQKVSRASIIINRETTKKIGMGLVVLLGIEESDTRSDIEWLSRKISRLRIFDDAEGVMNLSINNVSGDIMVISQFTLHASTKKGNRPSYIKAASPETAIPLYEAFIEHMQTDIEKKVLTGKFGAFMQVSLTNEGPVTIFIDTKNRE
ncbi:MAG: D-tyrosyl-tRNA(Tyr) deacylase [Deltaproteobacteria bacterium]|nr:MAG: D-tyrosyl-tRNA(Tyr) deacylase [Deltaproteobacteria bacterium]